jgi:hypothetical protein
MNANNIRKLIKLIASRQVENNVSTWQTKKGKFTWDFLRVIEPEGSSIGCDSVGCLVGLAYANELIPAYYREDITDFTDLDSRTVANIFYNKNDYYSVQEDANFNDELITPEMVSRELEKLLISGAT